MRRRESATVTLGMFLSDGSSGRQHEGFMASVIVWLDTLADEERRAREIIALFALPESRDEPGIGQIRQQERSQG